MSDTSASAKRKVSSVAELEVTPATETKRQERAQLDESAFAEVEANTFYQILLDETLSPEQKLEETAKALTFTDDKERAKQRLEEFNAFKEYLQFERKRMAQEIINLTDTEAFSELKQVFEDINTALVTFEREIGPLTDIVDAVYTLRMSGMTYDVFNEILEDREAEKERRAKREAQEAELASIESDIHKLNAENARLAQQKSFFGLGGIKGSAQAEIAANTTTLDSNQTRLAELTEEIKQLSTEPENVTKFAEFADEKKKLRELLDITSDEHKARQERLVAGAQDFINTTEARVASVLGHFDGMNQQIDNLGEANYTMRSIYAILNDATREANENNESLRTELKSGETGGEGDVQKMTRERKERDLANYISNLGRSHVDTTAVFSDLTRSGHQIQSMKEGNEQQVHKTRQLHTSGVAGVADQLSVVLQAVSAAALGESSEAASMSLDRMNRTTMDLSQKEVIRVAMGNREVNEELQAKFDQLAEYGETIRKATDISRTGLQETQAWLGKIEEQARSTQEDIRESLTVAADVTAGKGGTRTAPDETEAAKPAGDKPERKNPFGIGGLRR